MSSDLNMGGNNINSVNTIQSGGRIGLMGYLADYGYPVGWGGGVHTWDIFSEGAVGAGNNGKAFAVMSHTGEFIAADWYSSNGNVGWRSTQYGGGIYMEDTNWLRIYGDKGLYTQGQVQAGSVVSNGRIEGREYVQIDGTASQGYSCPGQSLIAKAADGTGLLQCVAGVWKPLAGVNHVTQAVSPNSSCGNSPSPVTASCPTGYYLTGGGYTSTLYAPVGSNISNAPSSSGPNGNSWQVTAGSANGDSCFAAYAVCSD